MPAPPIGSGGTGEATGLYHGVVLADKPCGYWRLGADLLDYSDNSNTLSSTGTAPTDATGLVYPGGAAKAKDFGGAGAYTAADHASLDVGDSFTVECWFVLDTLASSQSLFSKGADGFHLRYSSSEAKLILRKQDGGAGVIDLANTTGITFATATLYHVVATKDGANGAKIYVNGVDRTGTTNAGTVSSTATALSVGQKSTGGERVDGRIDEPAVYPYPLTADQATTHYAAGLDGTFGVNPKGDQGEGIVPSVKVEIAFDSTWNDTYPLWQDVSPFVRVQDGIKIKLGGRQDEHNRTANGEATVNLGNRDRRFDPTLTTGPYGDRVVPTRPIRIRFAYGDLVEWGFQGWVESWPPKWTHAGKDAVTQIKCTDAFARYAQAQFVPETTLAEALAGARIEAVLALTGDPPANVDAGVSVMPEFENVSGKHLDHLQTVADSDGGFLYVMQDGRTVYESRTYRAENEASPRAVVGDGGGAELPYIELEVSSNDAYLYNDVQVTTGDGTGTGHAEDTASIAEYGRRTLSKSVLTGFNEAQAAAEWYLARYREPASRFTRVTFQPEVEVEAVRDALWQTLLPAYNSNRFTFMQRPIDEGEAYAPMEQDAFIERIEYDVSDAQFKIGWSVSPFGDEGIWRLDDPTYVLGTNTYPTW